MCAKWDRGYSGSEFWIEVINWSISVIETVRNGDTVSITRTVLTCRLGLTFGCHGPGREKLWVV
jgi:hypothetical protein